MYYFENNAVTTLSAGINSSVTSVAVTDGSVFPANAPFMVRVGGEIIEVTARSGNTLTVVRGQEGTGSSSHSSAAEIANVVTKGVIEAAQLNEGYGNDFRLSPGVFSFDNTLSLSPVTGRSIGLVIQDSPSVQLSTKITKCTDYQIPFPILDISGVENNTAIDVYAQWNTSQSRIDLLWEEFASQRPVPGFVSGASVRANMFYYHRDDVRKRYVGSAYITTTSGNLNALDSGVKRHIWSVDNQFRVPVVADITGANPMSLPNTGSETQELSGYIPDFEYLVGLSGISYLEISVLLSLNSTTGTGPVTFVLHTGPVGTSLDWFTTNLNISGVLGLSQGRQTVEVRYSGVPNVSIYGLQNIRLGLRNNYNSQSVSFSSGRTNGSAIIGSVTR